MRGEKRDASRDREGELQKEIGKTRSGKEGG